MKIVFSPKVLPWIGARGECDICGTIVSLDKADVPQATGPLGRTSWYLSCPLCQNTVLCQKESDHAKVD